MKAIVAVRDRNNVLSHLMEVKTIADRNYKQQVQTCGKDRDMWSAVLGNVENALNRMK